MAEAKADEIEKITSSSLDVFKDLTIEELKKLSCLKDSFD